MINNCVTAAFHYISLFRMSISCSSSNVSMTVTNSSGFSSNGSCPRPCSFTNGSEKRSATFSLAVDGMILSFWPAIIMTDVFGRFNTSDRSATSPPGYASTLKRRLRVNANRPHSHPFPMAGHWNRRPSVSETSSGFPQTTDCREDIQNPDA